MLSFYDESVPFGQQYDRAWRYFSRKTLRDGFFAGCDSVRLVGTAPCEHVVYIHNVGFFSRQKSRSTMYAPTIQVELVGSSLEFNRRLPGRYSKSQLRREVDSLVERAIHERALELMRQI